VALGKAGGQKRVEVVFDANLAPLNTKSTQAKAQLRDFAAEGKKLGNIDAQAKRLAQGIESVGRQASKTARAVAAIEAASTGFTAIAGRVGAAVSGLQALAGAAQRAVQIADDIAGDALAAQRAAANLQLDISGAREAFKGYVDDVELARIANQAFELGVVQTGDELEMLAAGVQAKAERLGVESTQLFENAVTAIGRGSALILDNLGIILNQEKAERIYAESLGKTIEQLDALEKAEAFQKAAMIEIAKAGKDVQASVDGMAASYEQAKISVSNFKSSMLGFDDTLGRTREALRGLTEEELDRLAFAAFADESSAIGTEVNEILERWDVSLMDVKKAADELGLSYDELIKRSKEQLAQKELEREQKRLEAERKAQVQALEDEAGEVEHIANLMRAQGQEQKLIALHQLESLDLRRQAAELAGDEAQALALARQIEVERAKLAAPRRRGRRRDPNESIDRERDNSLRVLDLRRQLFEVEVNTAREADDRAAREAYLVELTREELDIRQRAAEQRDPRTTQQQAELEIEMLEIKTERKLADLEMDRLVQEQERRHAEERLAAMDRQLELAAAQGAATELLQKQRDELELTIIEQYGTSEELAELNHSRELSRIEAENAAWDSWAAKQQERHEAELRRIKEREKAEAEAINFSGQMLRQGSALAGEIIDASIKDDEKRQKARNRAQAIESFGISILEGVKAAAAFASFNYLEGAAHVTASVFAGVQGARLLAGDISGGGSSSSSTATTPSPSAGQRETSAAPTVPESVPAADSQPATAGGASPRQGGAVVVNINGDVLGSLDEDSAEKIGIAVKNAAFGREAVGE
jgi:hypothetical protein